MPRNVRNFWIELSIDGKTYRHVATGPVSKDGGFEATIKIRDNGGIKDALHIRGYEDNGTLHLWTKDVASGDITTRIETRR